MAKLILVRHGESEWNAKGLWTGLIDISLSEKGKNEAKNAAEKLKGITIDISYISSLERAKQTWEIIKQKLNLKNVQEFENKALNERDYGILTGQNKWQIKEKYGEDKFLKIRRGWDYAIEKGETLKNVYQRVIPYYQQEILPKLVTGKNILISAHGNSLRALVKYLENIPDNEISKLEIATGQIYSYEIDNEGKILSKIIL